MIILRVSDYLKDAKSNRNQKVACIYDDRIIKFIPSLRFLDSKRKMFNKHEQRGTLYRSYLSYYFMSAQGWYIRFLQLP